MRAPTTREMPQPWSGSVRGFEGEEGNGYGSMGLNKVQDWLFSSAKAGNKAAVDMTGLSVCLSVRPSVCLRQSVFCLFERELGGATWSPRDACSSAGTQGWAMESTSSIALESLFDEFTGSQSHTHTRANTHQVEGHTVLREI